MIAVENLAMSQGQFSLSGVNLNIPSGGYGVLMGPTGCGKTTVLEAIAGLRPVRGGRISLNNEDITNKDPADRKTGYVPQDGAMFPTMSVFDQLAFPQKLRGKVNPDKIRSIAGELGIDHLLDRLPQGLSGGERGRVALGRALLSEPAILLLDEPLAAVDEHRRQATVTLLRSVQQEHNLTVLHITHSSSEAEALASHRFAMHNGVVEALT